MCSQRGFTLLEALIGFMVLSIGMLGIASLQTLSLKAGKTSIYGSVAIMKVEELFESMRANPEALASYTGDGANHACTGVKICSATQLAQDDVFWWKQALIAGLPSTTTTSVTLTPAAAPSKMVTVSVTANWSERASWAEQAQDSGGGVSKSYTAATNICTEIPC